MRSRGHGAETAKFNDLRPFATGMPDAQARLSQPDGKYLDLFKKLRWIGVGFIGFVGFEV
jgi:hypothetical protein